MNPLKSFLILMLTMMSLGVVAPCQAGIQPEQSLSPGTVFLLDQRRATSQDGSASGAEVLENLQEYVLQENGFWTRRLYQAIHIRDLAAARDYGRLSIDFDSHYAMVELEFARVIGADGSVSRVSSEALQVRTIGDGQDFYSDRAELVFSLPNIEPDAIIELQYRYDTRDIRIPGLSTAHTNPYWFQPSKDGNSVRADPVRHFRFTMNTPASRQMHTQVSAGRKNDVARQQEGDRIIRTWEWRNLPEFFLENNAPSLPTLMPFITASSSRDWDGYNAWAADNYAVQDRYLTQVQSIVAALDLAPGATEDEKLRAVYQYLQNNVRYVYAHLGRGGFTPHEPAETLANGYGDCKDQTLLTLAVLKALGMDAYPALVQTPSGGRADTSLVRQIFDHILVYLPPTPTRRAVWMDSTGDRMRFPGMSRYMQGQTALIVRPEGSTVSTINLQDAEYAVPNVGDMALTYRLDANNRIQADLVLSYSGMVEESIRRWWLNDRKRDSNLETLLEEVLRNSGTYQITTEVLHADDLDKNIEIHAHFQFNEPVEDPEHFKIAASLNQLTNVMGWLGRPQQADDRKHAFENTYKASGLMTVRAELPDTYSAVVVQSPENLSHGGIDASFHSRHLDPAEDGKRYYEMTARLDIPSFTYTTQQYQGYIDMLQALEERSNWLISLYVPDDLTTTRALNALKEKGGDKEYDYQMALAQHHLDNGDFEAALEPAQAAVDAHQDSGEAWFLLGTAQGFNGHFAASDASFEKAISLGYTP